MNNFNFTNSEAVLTLTTSLNLGILTNQSEGTVTVIINNGVSLSIEGITGDFIFRTESGQEIHLADQGALNIDVDAAGNISQLPYELLETPQAPVSEFHSGDEIDEGDEPNNFDDNPEFLGDHFNDNHNPFEFDYAALSGDESSDCEITHYSSDEGF